MKLRNRILALVLALVCVTGLVAAAGSWDLNGDGKTNVWDLQLTSDKTEEEQAEALREALGNQADELRPNKDGKYEIWSELGLYNMASLADAGASFILMADIDMGGKTWKPVNGFKGHFDGNNKTISNVVITENVDTDMGFFAYLERYKVNDTLVQSVVENLNLRNVQITVSGDKAQYIGLLTGSNRGMIRNCTSTGVVYDTRTAFDGTVYVGTMTGRNNNHDTMPGTVLAGSNTMTVTAGSSNAQDQVTGITSQMAFFPAENSTIQYKTGIAAYSKAPLTGMLWQDTTGSIEYQNPVLQQRRQAAVDAMYQMGTVKWTTSEKLYYTVNDKKTSTHSNVYLPGTTYIGVPYNSCSNNYEMFLDVMQAEKDAEGRYVTVTGLEHGVKNDTDGSTGFVQLMGNDCSSAVGWAWAAVLPARTANNGVRVNTTPMMVPNAYNTTNYGVYPVGGYEMLPTDSEKYSAGVDARDTRSIIELNGGADGMAEYYAKASRGDALLFVEYALDKTTDTWVKGGGHARMLGYDPMIIREWDGEIDKDQSYVITHEQGDGLFDNRNASGNYNTADGYHIKYTSWRTDYKYPLSVLLTQKGYAEATLPGCGYGYVPVTVIGFHDAGDLRAPYFDPGYTEHPVSLPNEGWYYCNYMVTRAKMTIVDSDGNTVYDKTAWMPALSRGTIFQCVKLDEMFPDAAEALAEGQTYRETITCQIATGQWCTVMNNKAFTHPSEEILK